MSKDGIKALTVSYREGETIVAAGERGGCMFVVHSGAVRLSRPSEGEGADVELAVLEKGDFFGESAILEGEPYRFAAEATTESEIVEISAATLQQMLKANPEVAVRLLRKLSARLGRLETRLAERIPVAAALRVAEAVEAPVAQSVDGGEEEVGEAHGLAAVAGAESEHTEIAGEAESETETSGGVAVATEVEPEAVDDGDVESESEEETPVEVDADVEDLVERDDEEPPEVEEAEPEAEPASTDDESVEGVKEVAAAAPVTGPRLVSENGETCFVLNGDEILIGRYDPVTEIQPEIDLSNLDDKRSVSRRHARLTKRRGVWYLSEEVGALNGTFVNGVKLLAGRGAPISDGDTLSLGMVRVVYHAE